MQEITSGTMTTPHSLTVQVDNPLYFTVGMTLIIFLAGCKFFESLWLARHNKTNLRMCKNQKYASPVIT